MLKSFRFISALAFFCVTLTLASVAQPTLPQSKPGQYFDGWLKACSSGDLAQMTKWMTDSLSERALQRDPAENRAKDDIAECTQSGGYRLVEIQKSDEKSIEGIVVGQKMNDYNRLMYALNEQGKIDRGIFFPANPPEATLPKDLSDAALAQEIKANVEQVARSGAFSGIVEVARGSKLIVSATGGYANTAKKSPITGSSQFTLGSMGKMFTATAIGQLVDQKKMSFDDTVGKFFPEYANQTVRDKVTVGMLLSHRSGMGDFLSKRTPEMMKNGVKRAAEFVPLYEKDEPKFAPGTSWAYSNAGLALAGAIVEKISGEAYPDYLRKHIFAPAGMTNSDPNNIPYSGAKMVTPYTKFTESGPAKDWSEAEHDIGSPAGGAISTADDLIKFADALRNGKLVSKGTFGEMIKAHADTPFGDKYGYAMEIHDVYGRTLVGHGGGFPGVSTHLYMLLDSPYTIVVLANQDPPADLKGGIKPVALVVEKAKQGK